MREVKVVEAIIENKGYNKDNDINPPQYKLNIIPGINYIVVKESNDGFIKVGEPLFIMSDKKEDYYRYSLFGICRVGTNNKLQKNDVRSLLDMEKLCEYLLGVEVILDIQYARKKIDNLQKEITELENTYQLTSVLEEEKAI